MDGDDEHCPVPELVAAALAGDRVSWNRLVDRYTPLVLSVVRRYRLQGDDAEDVVQTVWLRLVEKLDSVRNAQALPGWIVTTTRHECLHVIRGHARLSPTDLGERGSPQESGEPGLESLLEAERHEALLTALAELPDRQRALLSLLLHDPPLSYEEISGRLGLPVGSIGPTRARALNRIRSSRAVRDLLEA